ncbi:DUF3526 domain-containing protein [Pedobacter sp. BMA]|uniref:DUF3526 domain-containing protein n=1 Tax=Pedobacter sp. BMA TaxID=1663685 RepID=UPI00064A3044|nr:DUF3526 domain-containing protein [Pedobacter sp. BMA]KLT64150.1 hypothetical protein AB669_19020 [Pedobacter sp. BMA]
MRKNTYNLEFKLFLSGSTAWIGIAILLITGFAGLYFGKSFIDNQHSVIKKASILQTENTLKNVEHFGKDIGLVFFHNKFSMANLPGNWAGFAIGQRDVNPYLISATMLALEGQIYDTDITNPVTLLSGNMDISFVFLYLFPLVIIAFTYNLISELKEFGIWSVLRAQTNHIIAVIWQKLLVRLVSILFTALILLTTAVLYLNIKLDTTLFTITLLLLLYLGFWFALSFCIISLGKSSNYNASALIAIWVLICIVIPAALNLVLIRQYPIPEALQNVINQREGYHEKWDMPKEVTMKPFFAHYPQLRKFPFPSDKSFSWFWYYGMQQMGDDQAIKSKKAMENKLDARQHFTKVAALFFPTIQTQLMLNEMAGTDLSAHLQFQESYRKYHEQVRLHFYPAIFLEQDIHRTNLKDIGLKQFIPQKKSNLNGLLSIAVITLLLIAMSLFNFRKARLIR